jgi:putative oxidoreductase
MKKTFEWLFNPPVEGSKEIIIIRLMTGSVFFWEGILKFVYPNQGVGRFIKLGFPMPETLAHIIAVGEIVGGLFILFGFLTRATSLYFILQMIVAILATKVSLYLGTSPLPLPPSPPTVGFWAVLHETRADWAQLLTSVFLLLVGPGRLSFDYQRNQL